MLARWSSSLISRTRPDAASNAKHRKGTKTFRALKVGALYFNSYGHKKWGLCVRLASGGQLLVRAAEEDGKRSKGMDDFAQHVAKVLGVDLEGRGGSFHVPSPVKDVTTNECVRLVVQSTGK